MRNTFRKGVRWRREIAVDIPKRRRKENKHLNQQRARLKETYFKKFLKKCPICGRTRRSGYIYSCPYCGWVIEQRNRIEEIIYSWNLNLNTIGINLRCSFLQYRLFLTVEKCFPFSVKDNVVTFRIMSIQNSITLNEGTDIKRELPRSLKSKFDFLIQKVEDAISDTAEYRYFKLEMPELLNRAINFNDAVKGIQILRRQYNVV